MQAFRLSYRQWFWTLVVVGFVWAFAGGKVGEKGKEFMVGVQGYLYSPIGTLMVPGSFLAEKMEGGLVFVGQRLWAVRTDNRSVEELSARVKRLESELTVANQTVKDLQRRLAEVDTRTYPGIGRGDRLAANITARNPGDGTNLVYIDKGRSDGIRGGAVLMPVISNSCIVGRIAELNSKTASVRLLTDPRSAVQAKIVKQSNQSVVVEKCLVEGRGSGQLICKSVEKASNRTQAGEVWVEVGDLVVLADAEWPGQLRNFIVGVVAEAPRAGDNPYRYDIRIKPSVNVTTLQSVDVLVKY